MKFKHLLFFLPFLLLLMANDCGGDDCKDHCNNGKKDCGEEDVDCGGEDCEPCITCDNFIKDGDEEGIDCGGSNCDPCHEVSSMKELLINDIGIVTSSEVAKNGAFHIGTLLENMEGNGLTKKDLMLDILNSFLDDTDVNSFTVRKRSGYQRIKENWMRKDGATSDENWDMNFANAPFRLLAITNRLDLNPPEGRLVFGMLPSEGRMTIIFEYQLPVADSLEFNEWALKWHSLSKHESFDSAYIAELKEVVSGFTGKNTSPSRVNGSSIGQVRTNDIINSPWELREFILEDQGFTEATRKMTPDNSFQRSQMLSDWMNDSTNDANIRALDYVVPESFDDTPFLSGNVLVQSAWNPPGVDPAVRKIFAERTCDGCHSNETTPRTNFVHFEPARLPSEPSQWLLTVDLPEREVLMIRDWLQMDQNMMANKSKKMRILFEDNSLKSKRKSRVH